MLRRFPPYLAPLAFLAVEAVDVPLKAVPLLPPRIGPWGANEGEGCCGRGMLCAGGMGVQIRYPVPRRPGVESEQPHIGCAMHMEG